MSEREKFTGVLLPRFWEELAHLPLDVRALAAWLITGAHNDAVPGLAKIAMATIADELRVSEAELERLWRQLPAGFVEVDRERRVVRVPNQPRVGHSPNHRILRLWWRGWKRLPDCPMRTAHVLALKASLKSDCGPETVRAWEETFGTIDTSMVGLTVPVTIEPTVHVPSLSPGTCPLPSSERQKTTQPSEASSPRARAKPQQVLMVDVAEVGRLPANDDQQRVVDHFHVRFLAEHGSKPTWTYPGGKSAAFRRIKDLVLKVGPDEFIRRIDRQYDDPPKWPKGKDITTLLMNFDAYAGPGSARASPGAGRERQPLRGQAAADRSRQMAEEEQQQQEGVVHEAE